VSEPKRVLPPTYFLVALVATLGLHWLLPVRQLIGFPVNLAGAVPILAGIVLNLLADRLFKVHDTTVKPFRESSALVTSGVFRRTRNPMYLGLVLILLGCGWIAGSATALVPGIVFGVLMDRRFIRTEESMLAAKHPEAWREYRSHVRRWI
jgi:protein-S-isoprenylcysteine O-methyltransferase Ste14